MCLYQIKDHKGKACHVVTCKNGMIPSRAIAWRILGAPVRLCSPAPQQEKNEPITITHEDGQASVATARVPLTDSPYLLQKQACKNRNNTLKLWLQVLSEGLNWFSKHFCKPLLLPNSTYLSRSTTPSIHAPNNTTQERSV